MDQPSSTVNPFPWRVFWVLFAGGILSILAVIPLAIELVASRAPVAKPPDIPWPILLLVGAVQNLALLAFMIWIGLKLSRKLGLGAPLIESFISGKPANIRRTVVPGLLTGVVVGIILLCVLLVLVPRMPNLPFVLAARLAVWKRFLICFYGGIYEELLSRLFLLSLFAWLADRGWRKTTPALSSRAFWIANIIVAILFGLGHLPSASLVMPITPLVVVAALALNGIAAVSFGYLYRKRGLEAAMVAHFTADFVIYVAGASLLQR